MMMTMAAKAYCELLKTATADTLTRLRSVGSEEWCLQLASEKATPLWIAGHLGNTLDRVLLHWVLGQPRHLDADASRLFAPDYTGGLPPSPEAEMYPSPAELIARYAQFAEEAIPRIGTLSEAELAGPPPGPIPEGRLAMFPTVAVSLQRIALHDAYHRGQLAMILHYPR